MDADGNLIPEKMVAHGKVVLTGLANLINGLDNLGEAAVMLTAIVETHTKYGIGFSHYKYAFSLLSLLLFHFSF